jgi:hypothetical protein
VLKRVENLPARGRKTEKNITLALEAVTQKSDKLTKTPA